MQPNQACCLPPLLQQPVPPASWLWRYHRRRPDAAPCSVGRSAAVPCANRPAVPAANAPPQVVEIDGQRILLAEVDGAVKAVSNKCVCGRGAGLGTRACGSGATAAAAAAAAAGACSAGKGCRRRMMRCMCLLNPWHCWCAATPPQVLPPGPAAGRQDRHVPGRYLQRVSLSCFVARK